MANNKATIKWDDAKLQKLLRLFKDELTVKVGIIGSKATQEHKSSAGLTNAELGTKHEFGEGVPRRSFLEASLKLKLNFNKAQMRKLRVQLFKQFFQKGTPKIFMQDLGAEALRIINEAFATNGFGRWKPWSESYRQYRASLLKTKRAKQFMSIYGATILTLTGQLRKSISFKILQKKRQNGK